MRYLQMILLLVLLIGCFNNNDEVTFTKRTYLLIVNDGADGYSSTWGYYNNDGYLELFVASEGDHGTKEQFLYRNNQGESFERIENNELGGEFFPMAKGAAWGDYNNDGYLDMLLDTGYRYGFMTYNTFFLNDGKGDFFRFGEHFIVDGFEQYLGNTDDATWVDYNNFNYWPHAWGLPIKNRLHT